MTNPTCICGHDRDTHLSDRTWLASALLLLLVSCAVARPPLHDLREALRREDIDPDVLCGGPGARLGLDTDENGQWVTVVCPSDGDGFPSARIPLIAPTVGR